MPPVGWKTITVPEEIFNYFKERYEKERDKYYREYGISSFSGFVTKALHDMLEDHESRKESKKAR